MFHTDDSMKIDDINKEAKRHMVYIWPEKGVFAYTYTLKKLAPGGIWTHTVRAGEGATTLRVSAHLVPQVPQVWWRHCYLSRQYD